MFFFVSGLKMLLQQHTELKIMTEFMCISVNLIECDVTYLFQKSNISSFIVLKNIFSLDLGVDKLFKSTFFK